MWNVLLLVAFQTVCSQCFFVSYIGGGRLPLDEDVGCYLLVKSDHLRTFGGSRKRIPAACIVCPYGSH